jgi:hypothetical protein
MIHKGIHLSYKTGPGHVQAKQTTKRLCLMTLAIQSSIDDSSTNYHKAALAVWPLN